MIATKTDALEFLAGAGASFALIAGRGKKPGYDNWESIPLGLTAATNHTKGGNNVGILTGYMSDGIRAIDIDRDYTAMLDALGPFTKTAKIIRDNAPDRGKLLFRARFDVKSRAWRPWWIEPAPGEKRSPWVELLSDGRHALTEPSEFEGGKYKLVDTHLGIAEISEDDLALIWYMLTENRPGLSKPPQPEEPKREPRTNGAQDADKATVLGAWSILDVFKHFGWVNETKREKNGDLRLLGNGGLTISKDKGWYCFSSEMGGGDAISAWQYCKTGKPDVTGRAYWDLLREMAAAKGLTLSNSKTSTTTYTNGNGAGFHNETPEDPPWDQPGGDDAAPPQAKRFPRLTLAQMMAMPPKQWLIDQILGRGDLVMLYGAPGSGKTFVALDLAFSAALGRTFAGRFAVAQPLVVAYAGTEGSGGLAQRLQAAAEYYNVESDELVNLQIYTTAPQLFNAHDPCSAHWFIAEYQAALAAGEVAPLDLLILDTFHGVISGADENSSQDMGEVLHQVRRIADALGCAVIVVHHANKNGTAERGSSALRGAMDAMIEVKEIGNGRMMTCEKLKDGQAWKPQTLELIAKVDSVRVEWGQVGDASRSDATPGKLLSVLQSNPGMRFTAKSLSEAIGAGFTATTTALNRLTERGEINRGLEDAAKANSNRNPWVYWV